MTDGPTPPQASEYDSMDALLADLSERAWQTQDRVLRRGKAIRGVIHIPESETGTDAVCTHAPSSGKPSNKPLDVFPESYRDEMSWCEHCLCQWVYGVGQRAVQAAVNQDRDAIVTTVRAVVDARSTPKVFHTRTCGNLPAEVERATEGQMQSLRECEVCRGVREAGSVRPLTDSKQVRLDELNGDPWRFQCPDCGSHQITALESRATKAKSYPLGGQGKLAAEHDRRAGASCGGCGERLCVVRDKKSGEYLRVVVE